MVFSLVLFSASIEYAAATPDFTQTGPSARYDNGIVYVEYYYPGTSTLLNMTHYEELRNQGGSLFTIEYHENGTFKKWTSYHWNSAQPERIVEYYYGGNIVKRLSVYDANGNVTEEGRWNMDGTQTAMTKPVPGGGTITISWDGNGNIQNYVKRYESGNVAARLHGAQFQSFWDSQGFTNLNNSGSNWQYRFHATFNTYTCFAEDRTRHAFNEDNDNRCPANTKNHYHEYLGYRNQGQPTGGSTYDIPYDSVFDRNAGNERPAQAMPESSQYSPGIELPQMNSVAGQQSQQPSFAADSTLISNIKEYAAETYRGQDHIDRWHRVLKTLGVEEFPSLTTMTSGEAYTYVQQGWNRWIPVVAELKVFEAWQQQPQPEQPQQPPQQQPIPVNLISNGSFEAPIVTEHNGQWQQFTPSTAGISWTVTGDSLELQRNILGGASDGSQHAELDAQGSVTISQTLDTVSGQTYEISFDYKARPNTASNTNGMNVTWNGVDIAPNLTFGNTWQTHTVNATGTGSDTISFADASTSDGIGTFLDNVSVVRTTTPEVPQPTPEVPQPTPEVPQPTPEVPQPTPEVPQPTPEVPQPTPEVPQPTPEVPQPTPEVPQPTPEVPQPTPEVPQPTPEVPQPTPEVPQPTPEVPQPTPEVPQPTPEVPQPTPEVPQPTPADLPESLTSSPLYQAIQHALDNIPQNNPLYPTFQRALDYVIQSHAADTDQTDTDGTDQTDTDGTDQTDTTPTPTPTPPQVSPDEPLTLSVSDAYAVEGDSLAFGLALNKPSTVAIDVYYITIDWTATTSDYEFSADMVTFSPGQTLMTVLVPTIADGVAEDPEKMMFEITIADGAKIGNYAGAGIILDRIAN